LRPLRPSRQRLLTYLEAQRTQRLLKPVHCHIYRKLRAFERQSIVTVSESAMRHLLNWALSALAVWIVARLVPGFHVSGPLAALIAALVIGFVNATLGVFLKIVTFPLVLLTLGLFWLVINAAMIELASAVVPGFHVDTFGAAFVGAIVLALVNMFFRWLAGSGRDRG
jgi:putative membrane protein